MNKNFIINILLKKQLLDVIQILQILVLLPIMMLDQQGQKKEGSRKIAYNPFAGTKEKLQEVPREQRQNYISKVLSMKPSDEPPPLVFQKAFEVSEKFTFENFALNFYSRQNTKFPKAIVVHFHGMSSHGGTSGYFSSVITNKNKEVNFYALDQMNFGQSQGPYRGLVSTLQESANQGEAFVAYLLQKFEQKPKIFLCGSSYGGSIIFKMVIKQPKAYAGAIFLNPALRNLTHNFILQKIGLCLGWLLPRVRIPVPESSNKGHKYDNSKRIKNDLFYYNDGLVPGSIRNVLNGINEISESFGLFQIPYIVFQGGFDKLVDLFAPLDLQEQSPSKDKTTIYCQNLWHSVFNEQQIEGISQMTANWLQEKI